MNAAQRDQVRFARDARVRAALEPLQRKYAGFIFCGDCGGELNDWTPGCQTCSRRWRRWVLEEHRLELEPTYVVLKARSKVWTDEMCARAGGRTLSRLHAQGQHGRPAGSSGEAPTWGDYREALGVIRSPLLNGDA